MVDRFIRLIRDSSLDEKLFCQAIRSKLESLQERPARERKRVRQFKLKDGMLFRQVWMGDGSYRDVIVIPKSLQNRVMSMNHDEPTSGHLSTAKTYNKIHEKYFWPRLYASVERYVSSCDGCQRRKIPKGRRDCLQTTVLTEYPFQRVACDFVGPLVPSDGKKYIIILIDYFMRLVITEAVNNFSAKTNAKFLIEDLITEYG